MLNNYSTKVKVISFFMLLIQFSLTSQELFKDKNIDTVFNKYAERPRETAYVHLNKSTYITNEDLGFSAYVFSKDDKKLSLITKNLYCVIKDKNNKTVKETLLKVDNGFAANTFKIDSLFTSGQYKFFAYTNWMKNFKEQNFSVQSFTVINPDETKEIKNKSISDKIDAQFLPESGHLLANTRNAIGVIIKDEIGFGIPNISGDLLDEKNEVLASFTVNNLGIGRFSFVPENDKKYLVRIVYNNKESFFKIDNVEQKGIVLSTIQKENEVILSIKTNDLTLPNLRNKQYKVTLHNGKKLTNYPVKFDRKNTVYQVFETNLLSPGINVFTLFDDSNNPIAERLVFNYKGLKTASSDAVKVKRSTDSLAISISYKNVNTAKLNNVSISVLPANTIAYKHHHNIISYNYLQPYLKGEIENAQHYFNTINNQTKYQLDNLLITQGWSSYSWYTIFNQSEKINHFFEKGITLKANVNNNEKSKYAVYSVNNRKPNYYILEKNEKEFLAIDLFPSSKEKIKISKIESNGKLVPAKLYPQFFPSSIPELKQEYIFFNGSNNGQIETKDNLITTSLNEVQQVDEVIIKANLEKRRIEKIKSRSPFGKVHVFNEMDRNNNITLANYLNSRGFNAEEKSNVFFIEKRGFVSINAGSKPTIYLDGNQLFDFQILYQFDMTIVDYIDINKNGIGEGIRGGAGVIKIYTDPQLSYVEKNVKTMQEFKFPLIFSESKKYYTPKYKNYNSNFYRNYGVVEWLPKNKINEDGTFSFKVANIQNNSIKLFIEGYANDGTFISETKEIRLD